MISGAVLWGLAGILCLLYAECQRSPIVEFAMVAGAAGCWVAGALCVIL